VANALARFLLCLGLPAAGCAVAAGAPSSSDLAVNQCESTEDCGGGECQDHLCHATHGDLSSLLVTVTRADSGATHYLDYPATGKLSQSGVNAGSIALPSLVQLTGSLRVPIGDGACKPTFIRGMGQTISPNEADGEIPGDIVFRRSRRTPGLPVDTYRGVADPNGYTFGANLPPDDYDIYIRPLKQPLNDKGRGDTDCAIPPRLILKQSVTGNLDFKLVAASKLDVNVVWPKGGSPAGWTLDLVDPATSYAMSLPRVLTDLDFISESANENTYAVKLDYVPIYGPDAKGVLEPQPIGTAVLRLTPPVDPDPNTSSPDDVIAPVLFAQLTGTSVDPDQSDSPPAELRQSAALPDKVTVQFQLELYRDASPAAGSVLLTATDLPGFSEPSSSSASGISFTRTVTVDATGLGMVDLLPGTYRVVVTPDASCDSTSCLRTTQTTWAVPASPSLQKGKTLQIFDAVQLGGSATVANGAPAVGATVRALASPSIVDLNIMNQGDAKADILPRSRFGQVDAQGDFFFGIDSGTYDFRVEPDPGTGFAWLVHPQVTIAESVGEKDLGGLRVPLPIVYRGQITSGSSESQAIVPSALIRAFVYLARDGKVTPQPTEGAVAVQVAETHSDSAGNFTLLVPAKVGL